MLDLGKDEGMDLTKDNGETYNRLNACLGWDESKAKRSIDLDVFAFLLNDEGILTNDSNVVYYKNLQAEGVRHMGDDLVGGGNIDNEIIKVTLDELNPIIARVLFVVTIFKDKKYPQQLFNEVSNAYIRIDDADDDGKPLCKFTLSDVDYKRNYAIVAAEFRKEDGRWSFNPIGNGANLNAAQMAEDLKQRIGTTGKLSMIRGFYDNAVNKVNNIIHR